MHVPTRTYDSMIQGLTFTPSQQRDFIKTCLGPALKASVATRDLKLMMLDDQRAYLPDWVKTILSDPDAAKYISGIGLHWCVHVEHMRTWVRINIVTISLRCAEARA